MKAEIQMTDRTMPQKMARHTSYYLFDQIVENVENWAYIKSKLGDVPNGLGTDKFYQIIENEP